MGAAMRYQPQGRIQFASGLARKPIAAFVPSPGGIRIIGDGKHDAYGLRSSGSIVIALGPAGYATKPIATTADTFRLNALANQTDTIWEKPSSQVTVMLVFRRFAANTVGNSPIFSNQAPNTPPFCGWALIDQTTGFAAFETSAGGSNVHLNATAPFPGNQLTVLIGRYDGAKMDLWQNGQMVGSMAASGPLAYPNSSDRGPSVGNFYNYTASLRTAMMEIYGGALWDVAISDAEIARYSANPWQLFDSGSNSSAYQAAIASASASSGGGAATNTPVNPSSASLGLTGYAPTVVRGASVAIGPAPGGLSIAGYAPAVTQGTTTNVGPGAGTLSIAGYAPSITQSINASIAPGSAGLALAGYAPTVARTASQSQTPQPGALTITGYAPTVVRSFNQSIVVPASAGSVTMLALTGYAPSISQGLNVVPQYYNATIMQLSAVRGTANLGPDRIQQTVDLV